MASSATISTGILVKRGDGATPEVFTTVAEVVDEDGPNLRGGTVPVGHNDATDSLDKIAKKLIDGGEITLTLNFLPANTGHKGLITDMYAKTRRNWQIVWTDSAATTWPFTAYVIGFKPTGKHETPLVADVTIDITGKPTFP